MPSSGFAANTIIIMCDGKTKKIQDIKPNNKIISIDGSAQIINKITKGTGKMYDIISVKGTTYTVPGDHVLLLKISTGGMIKWCGNKYKIQWLENFSFKYKSFSVSNPKFKEDVYKKALQFIKKELPKIKEYSAYGDIVKITVDEYMKLPKYVQKYYKGFSHGIEFPNKEVDVDPYIFGYWLGDGTSADTKITTAEPEIVEAFNKYAEKNNLIFKKIGKSKYNYNVTSGIKHGIININPFRNFLKKYNLLNNKHIPGDYKMNSRKNQLKLLAGLIDSDGHYINNCYEIVFKSKKLAEDTVFLARSLGFKSFIKN